MANTEQSRRVAYLQLTPDAMLELARHLTAEAYKVQEAQRTGNVDAYSYMELGTARDGTLCKVRIGENG